MESSRLGYQKWTIAMYMMVTGIKGTSSMKLHRELGIHQQTAWFMMQRIREGFLESNPEKLSRLVEVDEAYIGGKRSNMHPERAKRFKGRGSVGKVIVVAAKERETKKISSKVVLNTKKKLSTASSSITWSPAPRYSPMSINRTRECPSSTSQSRTGRHPRHLPQDEREAFLDRYRNEFEGRHNTRDLDTVDQIETRFSRIVGKRLTYAKPIEDNGKESGARPLGTGKMAD